MEPAAMRTLPSLDISQCRAQKDGIASKVLLYCVDRLANGNRILMLSIASC
jgi:hypothetical protein